MTAAYTSIGLATQIADVKAALNAKSLITAIQYESATALIFTTPLLAGGKVVKILMDGNTIKLAVGSAWTSETTVTDQFYFAYTANSFVDAISFIADTDFFVMVYTDVDNSSLYHGMAYVGALENGDELIFGVVGTNNVNYNVNNRAKNLTDGVELYPITWQGRQFSSVSGKIITMDLMWCNSGGVLEENGDGTPAGTVGLKLSSAVNGNAMVTIVAGSHLLLPALTYMDGGNLVTRSSLIVEFS